MNSALLPKRPENDHRLHEVILLAVISNTSDAEISRDIKLISFHRRTPKYNANSSQVIIIIMMTLMEKKEIYYTYATYSNQTQQT